MQSSPNPWPESEVKILLDGVIDPFIEQWVGSPAEGGRVLTEKVATTLAANATGWYLVRLQMEYVAWRWLVAIHVRERTPCSA